MVWQLKTALSFYRWIEHKCGRLKEFLNFILHLLFEINMWPAWIFGIKMWRDTFFSTRKVYFHVNSTCTCLVVKYLVFLKKSVAGVISCAKNVARLKKKIKKGGRLTKFYGLAHFLGVIYSTLLFCVIYKSYGNSKFWIKPIK